MALPIYQTPPIPLTETSPQLLMWHWFWQVATPEQRAAAIEATRLKQEQADDRQIKIAE